jgi:hypothetical protein
MTRFRWKNGKAHGPWRPSRKEAREDAIKAGIAERDENGQLWWKGALAGIEEG